MMDRAEFEAALQHHGADLAGWPTERAAAARALMQADPAATRLHAEYRALDALLDGVPTATPSADLVGRILAEADGLRQSGVGGSADWLRAPGGFFGVFAGYWREGLALTAAAIGGLAVGLSGLGAGPVDPLGTDMLFALVAHPVDILDLGDAAGVAGGAVAPPAGAQGGG